MFLVFVIPETLTADGIVKLNESCMSGKAKSYEQSQ